MKMWRVILTVICSALALVPALAQHGGGGIFNVGPLVHSSAAPQTPIWVQSASASSGTGGNLTATFGSAVGAGNIVVGGTSAYGGTATVTGVTLGGVACTLVDNHSPDATSSQPSATFYCANASGSPTSLVATWTGSGGPVSSMFAEEYSGVKATSPLDAHASTYSMNITSPTSGSATTTVNNDLVFGYFGLVNGGSFTMTAGSGFTIRQQASNTAGDEERLLPTAGPIAAAATTTGNVYGWSNLMAFMPGP